MSVNTSQSVGQTNVFRSSVCVALRSHPEETELILVEMTKRTQHFLFTGQLA